jgi:ferredoxin-like protein FixX
MSSPTGGDAQILDDDFTLRKYNLERHRPLLLLQNLLISSEQHQNSFLTIAACCLFESMSSDITINQSPSVECGTVTILSLSSGSRSGSSILARAHSFRISKRVPEQRGPATRKYIQCRT